MSSLEREFTAAVENVELQVFIDLIRSRPSLSLAEIGELSHGRFADVLGRISVGQLIGGPLGEREMAAGGSTRPFAANARISRSRPAPARGGASAFASSIEQGMHGLDQEMGEDELLLPNGDVNTRTPAGRSLYDDRVMDVIRGSDGALTAPEIRSACHGTPLQVRKSLARLISGSMVSCEGKARATRYIASN